MIGKFKKGSASIYDDVSGLGEGYEEGPDLTPTGGEDYDPLAKATKSERQRQILNMIDNKPNTFLDELPNSISSGGQDFSQVIPYGPKESSDYPAEWERVAFETEQSKQLSSRQMELDTLKKMASNVDASLVDEPMTVSRNPKPIVSTGDPVLDKIRKENAQLDFEYETKKNMRTGGGKELITNPEFFNPDGTAKTYRAYYEEKIIDLELDIEMEKQVMGDSYEKISRGAAYDLATKGMNLDDIDKHLATELSDKEAKIKTSKSSTLPITSVGDRGKPKDATYEEGDIGRPRQDLGAPLNQVSKGTAETGDIFSGKGTYMRFDKDIEKAGVKEHFKNVAKKNFQSALDKEIALVTDGFKPSKKSKKSIPEQIETKARANLNAKDITEAKLVTKYTVDFYNSPQGKARFSVGPQSDIVKAKRYSAGVKDTSLRLEGVDVQPGTANKTYAPEVTPNYRYSTTGIEGVGVQPTPKVETSGLPPIAEDRSRKVFKSKYASGTVKGKEKTIVDLPGEDIKNTDAYNKAYSKAIASGLDDIAAVAFAAKAAKNIKKIIGKTNILNIPMLTKGAADDIMEKFYPGRRPGGY